MGLLVGPGWLAVQGRLAGVLNRLPLTDLPPAQAELRTGRFGLLLPLPIRPQHCCIPTLPAARHVTPWHSLAARPSAACALLAALREKDILSEARAHTTPPTAANIMSAATSLSAGSAAAGATPGMLLSWNTLHGRTGMHVGDRVLHDVKRAVAAAA